MSIWLVPGFVRGGGWDFPTRNVWVALRSYDNSPGYRSSGLGLRLMRRAS